ncbi:hypothetical protein [Synechococcus sp. CBW1107]|uniref:hypothetical protein n=1 Tax=Synechococcus sp. CBW1107 TaxID=2789857 RepID=UPI002AD34F17|nr:hypothetical protein [Synechococcus sp. CBW1107]CAK6696875.1 hypothetical protein IFHNHDMJ_02114 [Synechococcus sp. CBW1107]
MPLPRLARCAAFALLVAGSALAGLELVARFGIGLGTPPLSVADPLMEYAFVPDQAVMRFHNRIAINRYGMRSPDFPPARPVGQRRVLIFGDSVLFGGSTLNQEEIATSLIARRLGPGVVVGNVSAGSWGPGNWLGWVRRHGLLNATDVVLLTSSHDLFDHPTFAPLNPLTHPTSNPPSAAWELWQRYLRPHLPWVEAPPPSSAASTAASAGSEQRGLDDLTSLVKAAREAGASVVAVQFWERWELESGQMRPGHDPQSRLFRRLGVPVLDAGPEMGRCAKATGASVDALYVDEIHPFTVLGQRCLAAVLQRALTP